MDEAQIQTQLASKIPKDEPQGVTVVVPSEPGERAFDSNVELNIQTEGIQLFDYFDVSRIDRWTDTSQAELREVYRWASKEAQSNELTDVFNKIMELERHLGTSYRPDRLTRLARWVGLERQTQSIRAQQEMITNG